VSQHPGLHSTADVRVHQDRRSDLGVPHPSLSKLISKHFYCHEITSDAYPPEVTYNNFNDNEDDDVGTYSDALS